MKKAPKKTPEKKLKKSFRPKITLTEIAGRFYLQMEHEGKTATVKVDKIDCAAVSGQYEVKVFEFNVGTKI